MYRNKGIIDLFVKLTLPRVDIFISFPVLLMQVTAESDKKTFVYQGHIHSKDFGTFQLTRQGIFTLYFKQVDRAYIVNWEVN